MLRGILLLALAAPGLMGCALCANVDDCNYAAHGGRWQRTDMSHGRVGSRFAPAGQIVEPAAEEEYLVNPVLIEE